MTALRWVSLCLALALADCASSAALGAEPEGASFLLVIALTIAWASRPREGRSRPSRSPSQPLWFIAPVCLALYALLSTQWRGHAFQLLFNHGCAGQVAGFALFVSGCVALVVERFAWRNAAPSRVSPKRARAGAFALCAVSVVLVLVAARRHRAAPTADALTEGPALDTDAPSTIVSIDANRTLVVRPVDESSSSYFFSNRALALHDRRTGRDTPLLRYGSGDRFAALRYDRRGELMVFTRSVGHKSRGTFASASFVRIDSAWNARTHLAPPVGWIAMGALAVAFALRATRRCPRRNSALSPCYRSAPASDVADLEAHQALWALSSAALMITPLVFALFARMLTG